jgi:O-acetyl-ADP-ribose deacetylase (regulator of RNase III)/DNA-binding phage protein
VKIEYMVKGVETMPLRIVRNDITKMQVDAIVNAANPALQKGGGVCGAIFTAAGEIVLQKECDAIGHCDTGSAVLTQGYHLPAKFIIHTVGPIWRGGENNEAQLLNNCYKHALQLAIENKCRSIAFPLISSGIYGYPKEEAINTATEAISTFLEKYDLIVYLVIFDKKAAVISERRFADIEQYIDDHYVSVHGDKRRSIRVDFDEVDVVEQVSCCEASLEADFLIREQQINRSLDDVMGQLDESFSQKLLRLIDEKGLTDVQTYKKANIDRKLFSKIRNKKGYNPSKTTVIAFAIALLLNIDETLDLLGKAGYTLSNSSKFDVIIKYFIQEANYNIYEINEALFTFDQTLLGA